MGARKSPVRSCGHSGAGGVSVGSSAVADDEVGTASSEVVAGMDSGDAGVTPGVIGDAIVAKVDGAAETSGEAEDVTEMSSVEIDATGAVEAAEEADVMVPLDPILELGAPPPAHLSSVVPSKIGRQPVVSAFVSAKIR